MLAHIKTMAILLISNTSCLHKAPESHHPRCDHRLPKIEYVDFHASLNTFLLNLILFKLLHSIFEKLVLHACPEPLMKDYEIYAKGHPIIGIKIVKILSIILIVYIQHNVWAQLQKNSIELILKKYFYSKSPTYFKIKKPPIF